MPGQIVPVQSILFINKVFSTSVFENISNFVEKDDLLYESACCKVCGITSEIKGFQRIFAN